MDTDKIHLLDEFRLGDLLAVLWDSKLLIAAVTAVSVVLGAILYFVVPRTYESKVSVFPLHQTQFAGYLGLTGEVGDTLNDKAFPYTPNTLHAEFLSYMKDPDRLIATAMKTGIVERGTQTEAGYADAARRFASKIKFGEPDAQSSLAGQRFLNIQVRAGDRDKLTTFVQQALTSASRDMARDLADEVSRRASEIKDQLDAKAAQLQLDIDARRQRIEGDRSDEIVRVREQATIAHSLGIGKPLNLRAIEAAERGGATPTQINSGGNQPEYLQGYAALDERIKTLNERKDNDPFIADLRQLQQQLYLVQNAPRPARIRALLERSPLANPDTAPVARFSIASAAADKIFPRLSIFGAGSLFLGLLLGSTIALFRRSR